MATERLRVILEMAAGQYKREARDAATATGRISTEAKKATTRTQDMTNRMDRFGKVVTGGAIVGGVVALGRGLGSMVTQAERINSIAAVTTQVIEQTGGAANVTAEQVLKMSDRLENLTGVESEVVQEGANVLLTFRNIRNEAGEGNDVFDRTAGLMLDISTVMGTDVSSAAVQLGKALNDPVSQMGALSRAGLTFSTEQKQMIKDLVASNDLLGAQKLILEELETQLGGTAAASADSSDKLVNAFGRVTDSIALGLLPWVDRLANGLQIVTASDWAEQFEIQTGGAADSAAALATQVFAIAENVAGLSEGLAADALQTWIDTAGTSAPAIQTVIDNLDRLATNFDVTSEEVDILRGLLEDELVAALGLLESTDARLIRRSAEDAGRRVILELT